MGISAHIGWISHLRGAGEYAWGEVKRFTELPFRSGIKFGVNCVNRAYFYSCIGFLGLQAYSDYHHADERKIDPKKNIYLESIAHFAIQAST